MKHLPPCFVSNVNHVLSCKRPDLGLEKIIQTVASHGLPPSQRISKVVHAPTGNRLSHRLEGFEIEDKATKKSRILQGEYIEFSYQPTNDTNEGPRLIRFDVSGQELGKIFGRYYEKITKIDQALTKYSGYLENKMDSMLLPSSEARTKANMFDMFAHKAGAIREIKMALHENKNALSLQKVIQAKKGILAADWDQGHPDTQGRSLVKVLSSVFHILTFGFFKPKDVGGIRCAATLDQLIRPAPAV